MGEDDTFESEGKQMINNLLWKLLPGSITLDRAEKLACDIHHLIEEVYSDIEEKRYFSEIPLEVPKP